MFDMHYDLLTVSYLSYWSHDYTKLYEWGNAYGKENIRGAILNLYFMSKEEMKAAFGEQYWQDQISVLEMFQIATKFVKRFIPDADVLFGIEGCDYIEDIRELELLYACGLRSIILTWNNSNCYGSGIRSSKGLTEKGKQFIRRAIQLGIGIDLSHANEATFYDIIQVVKEQKRRGHQAICYVSHANARSLCQVERNLSDQQIHLIKEVYGLVGAVSYRKFVSEDDSLSGEQLKQKYLEHIVYLVNCLGVDSVMLSTDDMNFHKDFHGTEIFPYSTIGQEIRSLLAQKFEPRDIDRIMYQNASNRIFEKLRIDKENEIC